MDMGEEHVDPHDDFRPHKSYFCSFEGCPMKFDRPSRLQWHIRNHTGEKPYKCNVGECVKAYATTTKLRRHVRTFHKLTVAELGGGADTVELEGTTEGADDGALLAQASLRGHVMNRVDSSGSLDQRLDSPSTITSRSGSEVGDLARYKYKCLEDGCNKSFKRRSNLYNHRVIQHERRTSFCCPVAGCGQSFTFPTLLRRHVKTHEGYRCKQCPQVFSKWTDVRKHMAADHKQVHQCSSCSKTFKRPCDVHRHELTHAGSKERFACTEEGCGKSYDRVSTLRKHIRAQHHGELPHKCQHCIAAFPHLADLKRHEKYHSKPASPKKSYPAKGHRKISLLNRLIGEPCQPPSSMRKPCTTQELGYEASSPTDNTRPNNPPVTLSCTEVSNSKRLPAQPISGAIYDITSPQVYNSVPFPGNPTPCSSNHSPGSDHPSISPDNPSACLHIEPYPYNPTPPRPAMFIGGETKVQSSALTEMVGTESRILSLADL